MAGQYTTPTICVGPVRSHCHAISTSFSCAATPAARHSAAAAIVVAKLFIAFLLSSVSIGKRPYTEVISDVPPQAAEPFRLDHQEENYQTAEQDQPQIGDHVGQIG